MVVVSDSGFLDEGSVSGLIIFSFCVVGSDSTTPGWVVVGDRDIPVASSYETNITLIVHLISIMNTIRILFSIPPTPAHLYSPLLGCVHNFL